MNMWWNVYLQFQTKITDDSNLAGVPWAADQLLAPLSEGIKKVSVAASCACDKITLLPCISQLVR